MSKYSERFMYEYLHQGKNYGIIVDFFSAISENKNFLRVLNYMSKDLSYSGNAAGYNFASSCDEEDKENGDSFEDGVMFYLNDDDVIVDYNTFCNCLKLACDIYLEYYPDDKKDVEEKFSIIRKRYSIEL